MIGRTHAPGFTMSRTSQTAGHSFTAYFHGAKPHCLAVTSHAQASNRDPTNGAQLDRRHSRPDLDRRLRISSDAFDKLTLFIFLYNRTAGQS